MAKKFELNREGVANLMKSADMQAVLQGYASIKAAQAGAGYESAVHVGQFRAYANIYPNTREAVHDNWDHNTLEKVIKS